MIVNVVQRACVYGMDYSTHRCSILEEHFEQIIASKKALARAVASELRINGLNVMY